MRESKLLSFFGCNAKRRQSDVVRPTVAESKTLDVL